MNHRSEFGSALVAQLKAKQMTETALAASVGTTVSYVSQTVMRRKSASPRWIETVSDAMSATDEECRALHRAAARDRGYRID
jgi:cyanate lyase